MSGHWTSPAPCRHVRSWHCLARRLRSRRKIELRWRRPQIGRKHCRIDGGEKRQIEQLVPRSLSPMNPSPGLPPAHPNGRYRATSSRHPDASGFANVANDWHLARERSSAQCSSPFPGLTVALVHGRRNDICSTPPVEPVDWLETLGLAGEEFRSGNLRAMRVKSTMSRAAW